MDNKGWRRPQRRTYRKRIHTWWKRLILITASILLITAAGLTVNYIVQRQNVRSMQHELRTEQNNIVEPPKNLIGIAAQEPVLTDTPTETNPPVFTPYPLPTAGAAMQPGFLSAFQKNNDMIGWLKADAFFDIDFPVVKRDNSYYEERDFYRRRNIAGTVFLDADNCIMPQDQNLILHGHNTKNGTMFGKLSRLLERKVLLTAPFIRFSTLYDAQVYVPYAISLVSIDPSNARYVHLITPRFNSIEAQSGYVNAIRHFSAFNFPIQVEPDDRMLTLITCHGSENDERLVVALRALRPNENEESVKALLSSQTITN